MTKSNDMKLALAILVIAFGLVVSGYHAGKKLAMEDNAHQCPTERRSSST